jgi:hypothetical protein
MRSQAPLRDADMLTRRKQITQAQKFRQEDGAPTRGGFSDQELRWLRFLLGSVRSITPFRQQFQKILPGGGSHAAEREDKLSLLLD